MCSYHQSLNLYIVPTAEDGDVESQSANTVIFKAAAIPSSHFPLLDAKPVLPNNRRNLNLNPRFARCPIQNLCRPTGQTWKPRGRQSL